MAADIIKEQIGNDLPFDIDYVFPYVDNSDPAWIKQHKKMCKKFGRPFNPNGIRYRDYGTLKYVFRGIETFMPWIRNIYIIVERKSQIPSWLNKENVKVIYHKDIIPVDVLPTYNSTTIEMFLHRIPGLAEHFLYANDDMFPVGRCKKSDFFTSEGYPKFVMNDIPCDLAHTSMYRKHIRNGNELCCKDAGISMGARNHIYKSDHGIAPVLKSTCRRLFNKYTLTIMKSCSAFRSEDNFNQELFKSYQFINKKYDPNVSFSMNYIEVDKIGSSSYLYDQMSNSKTMCLNDGDFKGKMDQYDKVMSMIVDAFKKYFPNKSKYEN